MIRILHTADWHIGQTLRGFSREHEHRKVFGRLEEIIVGRNVDALIIAGDVFDSQNPSGEAQQLFYDTLVRLSRARPRMTTVIVSGNHDAAGRLEAPRPLRLVPPQYVKPFVKRGKNDSADAEAICEAAGRPTMHFVPVKSAARQAAATPLSVRELLVRQRTQLVNALRGHASEFGIIAGRGTHQIDRLLEQIVTSGTMPQTAKEMLSLLGEQIAQLDDKLVAMEKRLMAEHRADPQSKLLAGQPGIGAISAQTLVTKVDPTQFESGRHLVRTRSGAVIVARRLRPCGRNR